MTKPVTQADTRNYHRDLRHGAVSRQAPGALRRVPGVPCAGPDNETSPSISAATNTNRGEQKK